MNNRAYDHADRPNQAAMQPVAEVGFMPGLVPA
jgi:hypothetical protein